MSQQSLPRDAKLVRYMLLSYVHHLPVHLYATSQHSIETTVQIELLFGVEASFHPLYTVL